MNTAKEFFNYFSKIDSNNWIKKQYIDQTNPVCRCASGHLRSFVKDRQGKLVFETATPPAAVGALDKLLTDFYGRPGQILHINDGCHPCFPTFLTEQQSVLAALLAVWIAPTKVYEQNNEVILCHEGEDGTIKQMILATFQSKQDADVYVDRWNLLLSKKFAKLYSKEV